MNKQEHLYTILNEEMAELQKTICKILRFGIDDGNPASSRTNREELIYEMNDVLAMFEMINVLSFKNQMAMDIKKEKVEKYLEYSKQKGTYNEN